MAAWKTGRILWLLLPVLLLALAAPVQAGPADSTQCLRQVAATDDGAPGMAGKITPKRFQQLIACRGACRRSCARRYRCRQLPPRQRGACYAARAACLRSCGC